MTQVDASLRAIADRGSVTDREYFQFQHARTVRDPFNEYGDWAYRAGAGGGTVSVPSNARLLGVDAYANAADGTFTIAGGQTVTVRSGVGRHFIPKGNPIGPFDIVFSASIDYIVEWIEP